ncbi:MAG: DUF2911 domain-containing protein [Bacteroidetes bacterium]|nr:DUF2911 domain-containing protein [Bacteroidota bacterium]
MGHFTPVTMYLLLSFVFLPFTHAQRPPTILRDSVKEVFDGKSIIVRYGKPSLRGRKIFGDVVPFYKVWRTGAGAATEFYTEVDLEMNGAIVPRGSYSLYTIPTEHAWKFIINKQTGQWGTVYNSQLDLARITVKPQKLAQPIETLTFRIEKKKPTVGVLIMEWETQRIAIPFNASPEPLVPSPRTKAHQTIGGTTINIHYGQPSARGRKIFGGVVPYGIVWRTGANEATELSLSGDIWIGKTKIPRGTYSLYTLPTKKNWWLIINKQTGQWGTEYHKSMDLARVPLVLRTLPHHVEKFTIVIERTDTNRGKIKLVWECTEASLSFEVRN